MMSVELWSSLFRRGEGTHENEKLVKLGIRVVDRVLVADPQSLQRPGARAIERLFEGWVATVLLLPSPVEGGPGTCSWLARSQNQFMVLQGMG